MKSKVILTSVLAGTLVLSGMGSLGVSNLGSNIEASAKNKVYTKTIKLDEYSAKTYTANTTYKYNLKLTKKTSLVLGGLVSEDVEAYNKILYNSKLSEKQKQTKITALFKTFYKGNIGTVTFKTADGKKVIYKKTLKTGSDILKKSTLAKGNYVVEYKFNNNITKVKKKKVSVNFVITNMASVLPEAS